VVVNRRTKKSQVAVAAAAPVPSFIWTHTQLNCYYA
jgi:hypothetical protein